MRIIRDRQIVADDWTLIPAGEEGAPVALPTSGKLIVPLNVWQAQRDVLLERAGQQNAPLGVWFDSNEDPADIAADVQRFAVIAVNFPRFADGRGYSTAFLLRSRYGYQGELRAIGDVLRDQLFYMLRVGFNAFAVRADRDIEDALKALNDFSETYQASVDQPVPLFRRRAEFPASPK
jgi:uncharacterized protein (DUF934 family)